MSESKVNKQAMKQMQLLADNTGEDTTAQSKALKAGMAVRSAGASAADFSPRKVGKGLKSLSKLSKALAVGAADKAKVVVPHVKFDRG